MSKYRYFLSVICLFSSLAVVAKSNFESRFRVYLNQYQDEIYPSSYFYLTDPDGNAAFTIEDHSVKQRLTLRGQTLFMKLDQQEIFLGELPDVVIAPGINRQMLTSQTSLKVKVLKDRLKRKFHWFGCSGIGCWFKPKIEKIRQYELEVTTPANQTFCYRSHPNEQELKLQAEKCR